MWRPSRHAQCAPREDFLLCLPQRGTELEEGPGAAKLPPEATAGLKLLRAIWPHFLGLALGNFFTGIVTALSVLI